MSDLDNRTRIKRILNYRHIYRVYRWPGAARQLLELLADRMIDILQGIRTAGDISGEELGLNGATHCSYQASPWNVLQTVMEPDSLSDEDVFIDFGSGKGRVLYLAARSYPFKRVIGVEISERLNIIAKRNIQKRLNKLLCRDVEIFTADVSHFAIPDDVTIVFLFSPFVGDTFTNLVTNLRSSLSRRPRNMKIIYKIPIMHDQLVENGFRVISRVKDVIVYSG